MFKDNCPEIASEQVLQEADPTTRKILEGLLRVERRYLHLHKSTRRGITEELLSVIRREVGE